jgi:hypothetical protein
MVHKFVRDRLGEDADDVFTQVRRTRVVTMVNKAIGYNIVLPGALPAANT